MGPRPDVRGFPAVVLVASRHMMYEVGKGKGSQETTYAFQVFCFDHAIAHADRLGSQKLTIVLNLEGLGWRNLDLNCLKNIARQRNAARRVHPALIRTAAGRGSLLSIYSTHERNTFFLL